LRAEQLEDRCTPATLSVTTLADVGAGSLRQAILDANNEAVNPGADTIVFSGAAVGGTVGVLTMGGTQFGPNAFEVTSTIVIQGSGETIARDGAAPSFRLFYVSSGGNLTLSNVTLSNGRARGGNGGANLGVNGGGGGGGLGAGGAIYNQGTVAILNSTLVGNQARGGNGGAGGDTAGTFGGGGGGGGGMGGSGATSPDIANADGGGGGGGFFGNGAPGGDVGNAPGGGGGGTTADAIGTAGGVANGGIGGAFPAAGGAGGVGGGGGGGGESGDGGAGGIGGGGGGGGENDGAGGLGGAGGFGGGGGGGGEDGVGGAGGFGGGGGGGSNAGAAAKAGGAAGNYAGLGGSAAATQGSGGGGGGAGLGGAIFNDGGAITITGSTITTNSAAGGAGGAGGGTAGAGGAGSGNGAGVFNHLGTVTILNSTITQNTATTDGGGVHNEATMTISGTTISNNSSSNFGGGIRNVGTITIDGSTITKNQTAGNGGGINNGFEGPLNGSVIIRNSTISGNTAQGSGGAIRNVSSLANALTITNTTIVDNKAQTAQGGGINTASGTVVIVNATITGNIDNSGVANRAGGISATGGTITLANSVVAENTTADAVARNIRGTFVAADSKNNFFTFLDGNTNLAAGVNGNSVGANPQLGPLQNNGGFTQTRLPLAGSPLIGAGNAASVPTGTTLDQRGGIRIVTGVEIGAVEIQPPVPLVASGLTNGSASLFTPSAVGTYLGAPTATVSPFGTLTTNVRVASGDVNGDGFEDSIVVTGPGTAIRVAVVSGADNATVLVSPFDPFGGDFSGGGFVAAGDIDGDGKEEFAVTPDQGGGPRVTIFSRNDDGTVATRSNFFGIDDPSFRGGARSALGDVNRDGVLDLAVTAGFLGGPRAALFNGTTILTNSPTRIVNDFFAFPGSDATTLRNGSFVAAGDVNGDGFAELIFGGGPGGAPRVFILSGALIAANDVNGAQATPIANFFVANNSTDRGGVRLATTDADGDNLADLVAGSGEGSPSRARVYLGLNITGPGEPATFQDLNLFGGGNLPGGVFVG
jgi:hypothetical protein